MIPQPTWIYHITHIDNLPLILTDGGLRCCADLRRSNVTYRNIAYPRIQDRRMLTRVPCGPGGLLHDYVPFYFAPRSPMLYAIDCGRVPQYQDGQEPVLYLATTMQAVHRAGHSYVFTDGNAATAMSQFYEDEADLAQVDWSVMSLTYWNDTQMYPDRMRRRQAELLVHRSLPWDLVRGIGVFSDAMRQRVTALLPAQGHQPVVATRRHWYY